MAGELPDTAAAQRRGPSWVVLVVVALFALAVGSLGTLGLTQAADDDGAPAPATTVTTPPADDGQAGDGADGGAAGAAPDWVTLSDQVGPSVVAIDVRTSGGAGQGSGVVVSEEGRIITNHHVVAGALEDGLLVTLWDGRLYSATMVGTDVATDLAVIDIDDPPDDLEPAELGDSEEVLVGHPVAAIGNPLGLSNTLTTGVVSALDRPVTAVGEGQLPGEESINVTTNAIQVDAAINPGNSGGPLFDAQGRVIGINSSIATMPGAGGGGAGSIGLGFAIPSNLVALITEQLAAKGSAEHAFLGVGLTTAVVEVDGEQRSGAQVATVEPGSPAAEAGLEPGTVILEVDGQRVTGADSLVGFVRQYPSGAEITLTLTADGTTAEVSVALASREDALS